MKKTTLSSTATATATRTVLDPAVRVLVTLACLSTVYLYLYPVFQGCAFPVPDHATDATDTTATASTTSTSTSAFTNLLVQHLHAYFPPFEVDNADHSVNASTANATANAPFRILVLADPQLEGDSSLPQPDEALAARLQHHWNHVREHHRLEPDALTSLLRTDIPRALQAARKRLDLLGNDYYLAHIFRTLHWWSRPTHVTVLGDLIGSQWVDDAEFEVRAGRFWGRVFAGTRPVESASTSNTTAATADIVNDWSHSIINIAGNHDIGYAGDVSRARLDRFERAFGPANWDVSFDYPDPFSGSDSGSDPVRPSLHLVVLNSLVLDKPALDESIQDSTYEYIADLVARRSNTSTSSTGNTFTLLLTHLPLHKPAGVCVDSPYFNYWGDDDGGGVYKPHGLREQNHLSKPVSENTILKGLFGIDRTSLGSDPQGLILTGHDHHGCDTWHYVSGPGSQTDSDSPASVEFNSIPYPQYHKAKSSNTTAAATATQNLNGDKEQKGLREITLRSMMGDFGGNAGLLSIWFDFDSNSWQYSIQMCAVGVQHFWWAVHVLDLIALGAVLVRFCLFAGAAGAGIPTAGAGVVQPRQKPQQQQQQQQQQHQHHQQTGTARRKKPKKS